VASAGYASQPRHRGAPAPASRRFVLVFGLLSLGLLAIYNFPYPDHSLPLQLIGAYLRACARSAGAVLSFFDPTVRVDGTVILGRFPLRIVRSCDAGEAMALFVAAVVAFPATRRRRLLGAALGLAAIFAFNVVRIGSLYLIGATRPHLFDVAHTEVWPLVMIAVAALSFLGWATWARGRDDADAPPTA
jgi:exosortase H (IPTLxxWG-CTERM-specific)